MTTAGEKSKIENSRHVKPEQQSISISPKNGQQLMFRFVCKLRRHLLPQRKIIRFLFAFSTLFFVIFLVWLEETCIGHIANFYGNFHWRIVYQPIEVRRKSLLDQRINISVFVVLDSAERLADYGLAHRTLHCYCQLHGYPLRVLDLSREPMLRRECPQLDFMFRRHCALARFLAAHPEVEFALFLDADMGVVNPNHLLEERVHPNGHGDDFDLVLYERTFNGEIMAGSYFLRNSPFAIQFLHFWANYEFKVPTSFHGTDNGAIHAVFLDLFCGQNCADERLSCSRLWNASLNFATLVPFTACARNVLGDRNVFHSVPGETEILATGGKVILLTNFTQFWARDGWLTGNSFSPNDFIFHGWQKRYLDQPGFASWHSPLALSDDLHFDTNSCHTHAFASLNWPYKDTFVRTDEGIAVQMRNIVRQRREETLNVLKENLW